MHSGAGRVRNTAKISAIAVNAFSPPDSSETRLQLLAGRARRQLQAGRQRVLDVGQLELGAPAAEQTHEQRLEMLLDLGERGAQPLAALAVQGRDRPAQALERCGQLGLLGLQGLDPHGQLLHLVEGAQIDRAEPLAGQRVPGQRRLERCQLLGIRRRPGKRLRQLRQPRQGGALGTCHLGPRALQPSLEPGAGLARLDALRLGLLEHALGLARGRFGDLQLLAERRPLGLDRGDPGLLLGLLAREDRGQLDQPRDLGGKIAAPAGEVGKTRLGNGAPAPPTAPSRRRGCRDAALRSPADRAAAHAAALASVWTLRRSSR